jgi:hypothetical protein
VVSINTNKNLNNTVGVASWDVIFKDHKVLSHVHPMDVVVIRLKGHNQGFGTVLKGIVDTVEPTSTADSTTAEEEVTVTGRCTAAYLADNSLFLPVWDPLINLPTALTFGMGDVTNKVGGTVAAGSTPKAIFGYLYVHYVVGQRNMVGLAGIPNARFWLNKDNRFELVDDGAGNPFEVPYIQFNEDTCDSALSQLEITGFTETWVDEVGNVVYRPPQWSAAVSYVISTDGLINDDLQVSDVGMATYVEVTPSGNPGLSAAVQQALMTGRAPVPSSYVHATGMAANGFWADPEFIVDTDSAGMVTAKGLQNPWYQKQKKYGLRPTQVTSPLLYNQRQAQQQAQGLLRFYNRMQKTGTITIPGEPGIFVGTTIQLIGTLRGHLINRTFYVDGVEHDYVDGDHYNTILTLSHGRDPGDPSWNGMVLGAPNPSSAAGPATVPGPLTPSPSQTVNVPAGVVQVQGTPGSNARIKPGAVNNPNAPAFGPLSPPILGGGLAIIPGGSTGTTAPADPNVAPSEVTAMLAAGNQLCGLPYVYGGGHGVPRTQIASSYDCSSSSCFILYAGGFIDATTGYVSGDFANALSRPLSFLSGTGKWVTVWANSDHMFMQVATIWWDDGGPGPAYWYPGPNGKNEPLANFTPCHPPGF